MSWPSMAVGAIVRTERTMASSTVRLLAQITGLVASGAVAGVPTRPAGPPAVVSCAGVATAASSACTAVATAEAAATGAVGWTVSSRMGGMSEAFGRASKVGTRRVCDSLRTLQSLGDPGCLLAIPTLPPQEVDVAAARHGRPRLSSTTMSPLPIPDAQFDIASVGAGIAGAAVAYFCAEHARVLLLEREPQPGMHSTGRSAAMFMESYGPPQVRSLTRASRPFFESPPACFGAAPLIAPRGALSIGSAAQRLQLQALHEQLCAEGCPAELLSATAAAALVPVLRAEAAAAAVLDPLACDLDVHAVHQGFLRGARARGAVLACDSEVLHLSPTTRGWDIETAAGCHHAAVVVNAAGAWVDELAGRAGVAPIGIEPRRRSAFVFAPPEGLATHGWPAVSDLDESFYFKPDAGLLLGSPANTDPVLPHDVLPEEWDIALGIARIETATTLRIVRPRRSWAGLRSFVADGDLVGGAEPLVPGFFWVAALGGYGIQTSPAMAAICAAKLLGRQRPDWAAAADALAPTLAVRRPPAAIPTLPSQD